MPPSPASERQRHPAPLAQLADVELAPRLEADDEEEERHQPAVHPVAQVERDTRAAEPDRQMRLPDAARSDDASTFTQTSAATVAASRNAALAGLRREELAQRRGEVPRPRRALGEGACLDGLIRHRMILAAAHRSVRPFTA